MTRQLTTQHNISALQLCLSGAVIMALLLGRSKSRGAPRSVSSCVLLLLPPSAQPASQPQSHPHTLTATQLAQQSSSAGRGVSNGYTLPQSKQGVNDQRYFTVAHLTAGWAPERAARYKVSASNALS